VWWCLLKLLVPKGGLISSILDDVPEDSEKKPEDEAKGVD
jgi:hypothetical protein